MELKELKEALKGWEQGLSLALVDRGLSDMEKKMAKFVLRRSTAVALGMNVFSPINGNTEVCAE